MATLDAVAEEIRATLEAKNSARDEALARSRVLTRHCANTIKAIHRRNWAEAETGLETAELAARELTLGVAAHPDLYHSGYIQDALKELVEAFVTYALVRGKDMPDPASLDVPPATFLNGLAEAASELRRAVLDIIRQDHDEQAEQLLEKMDAIYHLLMAFDFPDAISGGLRHRVDSLRGVLERTRGDLTNSLRQKQLQVALAHLESQLGMAAPEPLPDIQTGEGDPE